MSSKALTKAQTQILGLVAAATDRGQVFSRHSRGTRRDVLRKLEVADLIKSAAPFAGDYHTVTITPAGRARIAMAGRGRSATPRRRRAALAVPRPGQVHPGHPTVVRPMIDADPLTEPWRSGIPPTPYAARRAMAITLAQHYYGPDRSPCPDRGELIGRVFMRPVTLHLPGWSKAIRLYGLVPRSIGGIAGQLPSWDSLEAHFRRKEKRQDRSQFK